MIATTSKKKAEQKPLPPPLAHPVRVAFALIGVGAVKGYELIESGDLSTYTVGRRRYASLTAINDFIGRREAAERGSRAKVAA